VGLENGRLLKGANFITSLDVEVPSASPAMFTPKLPEHKHPLQHEREQLETISLTVGVLSSHHVNLLNLAMNNMGKFRGSNTDNSKLV
jgi:hypothetical protein